MDGWNKGTLKSLFLPGGILLLAAVILLQGGLVPISAPAVDFYYYFAFVAGLLLAWRFHSSRVLFALLTLLLAHRAIEFFSAGRSPVVVANSPAFEIVALLLPLNFVVLSLIRERGLAIPTMTSRLALVFLESVFVAVVCRPGESAGFAFLQATLFGDHVFRWAKVPQLAVLAFAIAFAVLLGRFFLFRKPVEGGLLWALPSAFLALQAGAVGSIPRAYVATAALALATSIVESSYVLAYHDELTALPARRAFNEALLRLDRPYVIAVVDIDHFKRFNDTYGHDTGDQVLRMVAGRLARVTGGGQGYRVGGEEFSILFRGKSLKDVADDLELLRSVIQESTFHVRNSVERRRVIPGGGDRRVASRKPGRTSRAPVQSASSELSVTVSIGVAEASNRMNEAEQVIRAADKALYRAKQGGRNRVETATAPRERRPRFKRSIA